MLDAVVEVELMRFALMGRITPAGTLEKVVVVSSGHTTTMLPSPPTYTPRVMRGKFVESCGVMAKPEDTGSE